MATVLHPTQLRSPLNLRCLARLRSSLLQTLRRVPSVMSARATSGRTGRAAIAMALSERIDPDASKTLLCRTVPERRVKTLGVMGISPQIAGAVAEIVMTAVIAMIATIARTGTIATTARIATLSLIHI